MPGSGAPFTDIMQHQKTSNFIAARSRGAGRGSFLGAVRLLLPYIWPTDRADLKLRVLLAIVLMVASKFVTIAIPYAFKWTTDALAPAMRRHVPLPERR